MKFKANSRSEWLKLTEPCSLLRTWSYIWKSFWQSIQFSSLTPGKFCQKKTFTFLNFGFSLRTAVTNQLSGRPLVICFGFMWPCEVNLYMDYTLQKSFNPLESSQLLSSTTPSPTKKERSREIVAFSFGSADWLATDAGDWCLSIPQHCRHFQIWTSFFFFFWYVFESFLVSLNLSVIYPPIFCSQLQWKCNTILPLC